MRRAAFLLLLALSSTAAAEGSPRAVKVHRLGPGLAMLEGVGGNIAVSFGEDGVFLIDDQVKTVQPEIRAALATLTHQPLRFVFNTHMHQDHAGGNEAMAEQGAVIVAHDNVRKRLSAEQVQSLLHHRVPPAPPRALPIITFDHELTFHLNGEDVHVFHVEHAHTDGDAIVHFTRANLFHMGDTYFGNGYPYIDVDAGGGINGDIEAADRVLAVADGATRIMPGHGAIVDQKALRRWREMLVTIRDRVRKLKAQGRTLAEVQAARPTAEFDAAMGEVFIKPAQLVETVYQTCDRR